MPQQNGVMGAFVRQILPGTVAAQLLGELKPGNIITLTHLMSLASRVADTRVADTRGGSREVRLRLHSSPRCVSAKVTQIWKAVVAYL